MLMCYIDILNYFFRYNRSILHIILLGYGMRYDGIVKCIPSIACDARSICRLLSIY